MRVLRPPDLTAPTSESNSSSDGSPRLVSAAIAYTLAAAILVTIR